MKVSIVTISYNQAEFLERAIRSVIEQDYDDIEYIVVDAGSTDGSLGIIDKYKDYLNHVIVEPDQGPADGLNKGFSKATGNIYGFLNGDDMFLAGALSRVVKFFYNNSRVGVVSGHSVIIDAHDKEIRKSYSDKFVLIMHAYRAASIMQPSTFFKAECFNRTKGFNILNKSNWDAELFVDMRLNGERFAIINEILSYYRIHSQSITSSKRLDSAITYYFKRIFKKIMGRDMSQADLILFLFFKLIRYLLNPYSFYERISKGPIYGRK